MVKQATNIPSARDRMKAAAKERYADRNYDPVVGEDGSESPAPDDLDESIVEMLDEYKTRQGEFDAQSQRMLDTYAKDPMSADMINSLAENGHPFAFLARIFGSEKVREAFDSPEVQESMVAANEEFLKDHAAGEERRSNWARTNEEFASFVQENGLDDNAAADLFEAMYDFIVDGMNGKISKEGMQMFMKARNYDSDVETARHDGEVEGRNANIRAARRTRTETSAAVPPSVTGAGSGPQVRKPKAPDNKPYNPWDEVD